MALNILWCQKYSHNHLFWLLLAFPLNAWLSQQLFYPLIKAVKIPLTGTEQSVALSQTLTLWWLKCPEVLVGVFRFPVSTSVVFSSLVL